MWWVSLTLLIYGTMLTSKGDAVLTCQNTPNSSHSDVLAKALTVFSLPGSNKSSRLDLIFSVPEAYWTAVVGWWVWSYAAHSMSDIDSGTPGLVPPCFNVIWGCMPNQSKLLSLWGDSKILIYTQGAQIWQFWNVSVNCQNDDKEGSHKFTSDPKGTMRAQLFPAVKKMFLRSLAYHIFIPLCVMLMLSTTVLVMLIWQGLLYPTPSNVMHIVAV